MINAKGRYAAVTFKKRGNAYQGTVLLSNLALLRDDPAETMREVTSIYRGAVTNVKRWQSDIRVLRKSKVPLSARKAWELGDILHKLRTDLAKRGCRLDGLYDHLERHVGLAPRRARSFVTLRRYVENPDSIPENLTWHNMEKTAKSFSRNIVANLPVKH